ncbi:unnamed protein product [Arabis nemorensis]|uniref:Uncharacterized protein n=1 Tax=Arabis nemorensis TaxID=586526 RepID=A0A565CD37_9BRAS|nr:unnamed protein product [Arabis nemorensis]
MDEHALDEDALIIPEGPVTRSKTRKLAGAVQKLINDVRIKEEDQLMHNAVTSISATIFS